MVLQRHDRACDHITEFLGMIQMYRSGQLIAVLDEIVGHADEVVQMFIANVG